MQSLFNSDSLHFTSNDLPSSSAEGLWLESSEKVTYHADEITQQVETKGSVIPPPSPVGSPYYNANIHRRKLKKYLEQRYLQQKRSIFQLIKHTEQFLHEEIKDQERDKLRQKVLKVQREKKQKKPKPALQLVKLDDESDGDEGYSPSSRPNTAVTASPGIAIPRLEIEISRQETPEYRSSKKEKHSAIRSILPNLPPRPHSASLSSSLNRTNTLRTPHSPASPPSPSLRLQQLDLPVVFSEASIATGVLDEYEELVKTNATLRLDLRSDHDPYYSSSTPNRKTQPSPKDDSSTRKSPLPPRMNRNPSLQIRPMNKDDGLHPYRHLIEKERKRAANINLHSNNGSIDPQAVSQQQSDEVGMADSRQAAVYLPKLLYRIESLDESFRSQSLDYTEHSTPNSRLYTPNRPKSAMHMKIFDKLATSQLTPDTTDVASVDSSLRLQSPIRQKRDYLGPSKRPPSGKNITLSKTPIIARVVKYY